MPTRHTYLVLTNAITGTDEEFNRWYDEIHLGDVLQVPGIVAAQRFRAAGDAATETYRYCALYEIESDDPAAVLAEIQRRAGSDSMQLSPTLSPDMLTCLYSPLASKRQSPIA